MVRARYRVEKAIRLRRIPSPHENDRLTRPDRQTVRCAGDDTELEHHNRHRADFERRRQESQARLIRPVLPRNMMWVPDRGVLIQNDVYSRVVGNPSFTGLVNLIEASLEDKRHTNLSYTCYFTQGRLDSTNLINTLTCHSLTTPD